MTTKTIGTEADAIAAIARLGCDAEILKTDDGRTLLISPRDRAVIDVTDKNAHPPELPMYVSQGVLLQSGDSLIQYVNRFKQLSTILLCDIQANQIVALIDYHEGSDILSDTPAVADRNTHSANLTLPFSEEWKLWKGIDGKLMAQLDFARFIEENACDVLTPSGADLLEVCRDLQAKRKVDFRKAVRTASDNENFEYADTTEAKTTSGGIEIPSLFTLQIPVYFEGRSIEISAFLRWKLEEGTGLTLGVKLSRAEYVRQAMFREIVDQVAVSTDVPAMYGKIETGARTLPLDCTVLA
jgi:uncharacterized protein YfdQ (DUF2303 family)